ncbi:MAG: YggS family pyridoxal phosphate-dependent enzyme [Saprospiraceae bacterium]|nr:YggS family pyridoxal phosphate-dependent enzyme [Saprospiraceae bacterium]
MVNKINYSQIVDELKVYNANLVAVTKTKPVEDIMTLYNLGQRVFGENRVQELVEKQELLPNDVEWHLIGSLQRNKVKYIAEYVSMIHSVHSLKLLIEINKQAKKCNRIINCLLQFHIADEQTKFGLSLDDAFDLLNSDIFKEMANISILGVMGMATFSNDMHKVRNEFKQLRSYFEQLKNSFFVDDINFNEVSMGMSGDYEIALEEGSTLVRVGSLLYKN